LINYDEAFGTFFDRLAAAGINKSNTLFVFTVEEGDHFVGSPPPPADCDGVNTPCTYSLVGEVNGNLAGLLATQHGITTPFTVYADMAPTIYLTDNPSRTDAVTRAFGRALGQLTAVNPYTGQTDNLSAALADPVGMKALHMVMADPQRTPTLVMFAHLDYLLFAGAANCDSSCITVPTTPPRRPHSRGTMPASSRRSRRPGSAWSAPACATSVTTRPGRITRTPDRPCSPWLVSKTRMTTMDACSSISSTRGRYRRRCGRIARRCGSWERCISS
jgi:hypothetical protein